MIKIREKNFFFPLVAPLVLCQASFFTVFQQLNMNFPNSWEKDKKNRSISHFFLLLFWFLGNYIIKQRFKTLAFCVSRSQLDCQFRRKESQFNYQHILFLSSCAITIKTIVYSWSLHHVEFERKKTSKIKVQASFNWNVQCNASGFLVLKFYRYHVAVQHGISVITDSCFRRWVRRKKIVRISIKINFIHMFCSLNRSKRFWSHVQS